MNSTKVKLLGGLSCAFTICAIGQSGPDTRGGVEHGNTTSNVVLSFPEFARFTKDKRELARKLAVKNALHVPETVWDFFDAVQRLDWPATTNLFEQIRGRLNLADPIVRVPQEVWGPVLDAFGAYEQFPAWNQRLLRIFGEGIMSRIPPGSIYFGGTDAGRFVVSALCRSHTEGQPFFTITQNGLADEKYLNYLQNIYGRQLSIPTTNDSQRAFEQYLQDAADRLNKAQLDNDEEVKMVGDRVTVGGTRAVMRINEILVNLILKNNPDRKIYLEESHPMKSLYPRCTPSGLIFQVYREETKLTEDIVEADRKFWASQTESLLGLRVGPGSSLAELCAWALRVYVRSNLSGFTGSMAYVKDIQAQQYFSKCRVAQASFYEARGKQIKGKPEALSFASEADLAFRQAFALSPFLSETAWRYAQFLEKQRRTDDLKLLLATTLNIMPEIPVETGSSVLKESRDSLRNKADELGVRR